MKLMNQFLKKKIPHRTAVDENIECPHCKAMTPPENFNCIYCGEPMPDQVGTLSTMRYSFKGCLAALIALIAILAFLAAIL